MSNFTSVLFNSSIEDFQTKAPVSLAIDYFTDELKK
jgi:hypothetical protein